MQHFYIAQEPSLKEVENILNEDNYSKENILKLLSTRNKDSLKLIQQKAYSTKKKYVGATTYFRGLIEYSNLCEKNCKYCGIRKHNNNVNRYTMSDKEVFEAIDAAYKYQYGSLVIQAGERTDKNFIKKIITFLDYAKKISNGDLGITLSIGEQTKTVYQELKLKGADRFLLRIETTNEELYYKIHPFSHNYQARLQCLNNLQELGYQTGTGVMIGLPWQTTEDLANDLLFFKKFDIDMVGMGAYLEHKDTPLYINKNLLLSKTERLELALKMISLLRLLMKDINIASSTALQAINPLGREMGLLAGANIVMPNLTPIHYREGYQLYANKPCLDEEANQTRLNLDKSIKAIGDKIGYREQGNSPHYYQRRNK